jgi:hypothetical protein
MLQQAASAATRSVSEEIEFRIERSFLDDRNERRYLGSDVGSEAIRLIRLAMSIEGVRGQDWADDPKSATNVRVAADTIIAVLANLPLRSPEDPSARLEAWEGLQTAANLLARSSARPRLPFFLEEFLRRETQAASAKAPVEKGED